MNVFSNSHIANEYDAYYQTDSGRMVDEIEKGIIRDFLNSMPATDVLEVGCGTGHWTQYLAEKGFNVTAVDNSEAMLHIAEGKNIGARFLSADAEHLPFRDESFASMISVTMLEFVENRQKALSEMYRVLRKGGKLIIGSLNPKSVIGVNAATDETFKHARFLDIENLPETFKPFRILQTKKGVFLDTDFTVLDYACMPGSVEPAFIGILLQKEI